MNRSEGSSPAGEGSPFWSRSLRREIQYVLDVLTLIAAFCVAYSFRFDFHIPGAYLERALIQLPGVVLLQYTAILVTGINRFVWRYVGLNEVRSFLHASFYSATPLVLLRLGLPDFLEHWRVPLSVILMDTLLAFGGILGLRVLRRSLYERYERRQRWTHPETDSVQRVLLAGAGRAGVSVMREVTGRGDTGLDVVGFVDDDATKLGSVIHGARVLGTTAQIPEVAARHSIQRVVITLAAVNAETIRRIVGICERARLPVQIIPGLYEILQERVSISRFRDVEIEDLLGREPVRLDEEIVKRFLTGKTVMVTGAGGSIGAELCRQIGRYAPKTMLLLERSEPALFEIHTEVTRRYPSLRMHPLVGDSGDPHRCRRLLEGHRPDVVLHAAAHKHVPMMEENPTEAMRNNVLATRTIADTAGQLGVEAFVLVSTDKAVRPTSMMGASKRLAELVVQDRQVRHPGTRYVAVRFGNVLGSAGSVVPIFREQIRRGGPVTVTHPEATRYFMTIPEAAALVLEAGALGRGGEIMVLDMGRPVSILQLAKDMITLSGFKPFEDVPIQFTGLRPGEKLYEQLELEGEELDGTRHPKIFVGRVAAYPGGDLDEALSRLRGLIERNDVEGIRSLLDTLIPEARLGGIVEELPADAGQELLH